MYLRHGQVFSRFYGDCEFDCRDFLQGFRFCSMPSPVSWNETRRHFEKEAVLVCLAARRGDMAALDLPARSAVCCGDPDLFASEMIKMINDKEFRSEKWARLSSMMRQDAS